MSHYRRVNANAPALGHASGNATGSEFSKMAPAAILDFEKLMPILNLLTNFQQIW